MYSNDQAPSWSDVNTNGYGTATNFKQAHVIITQQENVVNYAVKTKLQI